MIEQNKTNPHVGSSFDDFLREEGIYEEAQARVLKQLQTSSAKARHGETVFDEFDTHGTPLLATNPIEAFRGQGEGATTTGLLAERRKDKVGE